MNKVINRNITLRAVNNSDESRTAEFVISSEKVDSYKTVFRKSGWMLDNYLKNPIVTYNHSLNSSNPDSIIGVSEVFFDGDLLIGRVTFEPEDINPLADTVFKKIAHGTLKMASVGAQIHDASFGDKEKGEDPNILYFNKSELVEWSIVPSGANKDAHKRNTETVNEIRTELKPIKEPEIKREQKSVFEAQIIINKNNS